MPAGMQYVPDSYYGPSRQTVSAVPRANTAQPTLYSGGQGKCATTILADQGDIVTIILDVPYNIRSRHVNTVSARRGTRAMHASTLHIPTQNYTDYTTTARQFLSGVGVPQREPPYGSQHVSQVCLGKDGPDWHSSYKQTFVNNDTQHPSKLHLPSFENRMNMNEGAGLKRVMSSPSYPGYDTSNRFWSQYNRVHNTLGAKLGPGEPQERQIRHQYNPLTGEDGGTAWQEDNKRVSGNRVLYNGYRKNMDSFVLG